MKIVCDNCGTRYSVSDEKVRGKVFKIRCKKCEEVIVVRGTDDEPAELDTRTAACWHVVLEGQQQGPYTAAQVAELVEAGQITDQTHCWREGFADWKRLNEIEVLAEAVSGGAPAPAAEEAAAAPPSEEPAAAEPAAAEPAAAEPAAAEPAASEPAAAGEEPAEDDGFSGFTAPDSSGAPPETAGDALSDMFGAGVGTEADAAAPAESSGEIAARDAGRDGGADLFAGASDGGGGGDLFGGGGGGGLFPDDPAGAAAAPPAATATNMTGARNESSVLFSLSNLQSLSNSSQPEGGAAPAIVSGGTGAVKSSDGSSGLIDIKTMASTTESGAPAKKEDEVDELLGMGGGFGNELGAPVLAPVAPSESSNSLLYAIIGVGAAVVIAIVVLVVVLVMMDDESDGTPTAGADQTPVLTPAAGEQPAAPVAPATPEPTKAGSPSGPAPVPITEDEPEEGDDGDSERGSSGTRRPGSSKRPGGDDSPGGEEPSKAASDSADEGPQDQAQVKRATNALDALLDGAVGPSSSPANRPTKSPTPAPEPEPSGLPASLSRSQVQGGMNRVAGRVRRCGAGQSGTVMVNVVITGSTGRVRSANVTGSFAGTPVGSCAARAVRGASFPRFSQPSLTVRYPFQVQ